MLALVLFLWPSCLLFYVPQTQVVAVVAVSRPRRFPYCAGIKLSILPKQVYRFTHHVTSFPLEVFSQLPMKARKHELYEPHPGENQTKVN